MRSRWGILGLILATLAILTAAPGTAVVPEAGPTRVLLLGDSVTQGSAGDWTWRYRLWRHLESLGADVDLVGPDRGLAGSAAEQTAYADPDFDQDHAARWGRWAADGMFMAEDLVRDHRPDVLVVNLGINDLVWGTSPAITLYLIAETVRNARRADPEVDVVLGELSQTWYAVDGDHPAQAVNAGLPALAAELSTPESQVVVARVGEGFRVEDTYDSSHPGAAGEVRIAAAVADALALLGVGAPYPRPLADVPPTPSQAPVVTVRPGDRSALVSWSAVAGATGYEVGYRAARGPDDAWDVVDTDATTTTLTGLRGWREYVVRVRPRKVRSAGVASVPATVVPEGPPDPTTTSLTVAVTGRTVRLDALVHGAETLPVGTVHLSQDGSPVGSVPVVSGAASLVLRTVPAGVHAYGADFEPADPASRTASAAPPASATVAPSHTATDLAVTVQDLRVELSTVVSSADGVPDGTAVLYDDQSVIARVPLVAGRALHVLPDVAWGPHTYRSSFEPGSRDFSASSSPARLVTLAAAGSRTTIRAPRHVRAGTRATLVVSVVGVGPVRPGSVSVRVGATTRTVRLRDGRVRLRTARLRPGRTRVVAWYAGDASTAPSRASATIRVKAA